MLIFNGKPSILNCPRPRSTGRDFLQTGREYGPRRDIKAFYKDTGRRCEGVSGDHFGKLEATGSWLIVAVPMLTK